MLADIGLQLYGPQLQRRFIDGAMGDAGLDALLRTASVFLAVALLAQGLFIAADYVSTDIAQVGTNRLREDLLRHVLRLDLTFHNAHSPGELVERIDADVGLLSHFLSRCILEILGNALLLVGAWVMLYRIDPRVGWTLFLFGLVAFGLMRLLFARATLLWEADRHAQADLYGFLEERLGGTEDIRSSGATGHVMRGFFQRARGSARTRLTAALFGNAGLSLYSMLFAAGTAVGLAIGAMLYRQGTITIGTVFLIVSYSGMLDWPIFSMTRQFQYLQQAGAAIGRVGQLLTVETRPRDPLRPKELPRGPLSVAFDGLSFAYEAAEPLLKDISLHLPAGGSLGLLGRTGSGKTTLTRLLFRLVDPTEGAVLLGGLDSRDVSLAELRRRVALVTQEVQLFHAALRDNLTFFDAGVPEADVEAAVRAVGLGEWLDGLPAGLSTPLTADGAGLSAGQAQLLALARVFLRNPDVVVLDEASSRLDPITEARIERALDRLLAGRTAIVIAHRLATIRRVDSIAILAGGRIVEAGPRAALAADGSSRFAALLRRGEALIDPELLA